MASKRHYPRSPSSWIDLWQENTRKTVTTSSGIRKTGKKLEKKTGDTHAFHVWVFFKITQISVVSTHP